MKLHSQAALTLKQRQQVKRLHEEGLSIRKLAQRFGVNPTTIQRWTIKRKSLGQELGSAHQSNGYHP